MQRMMQRSAVGMALWVGSLATATVWSADPPSAKQALALKPLLATIDYEIPPDDQIDKCKVTLEKSKQGEATVLTWLVTNPQGRILRRFVDSNQDDFVDQWRYYKDGVEVYRELDTNFNKRVDQMRCLNGAGSRWGIDTNEDFKLDQWKSISAEEVSREAVQALIAEDFRRLSLLFATTEDLASIGLGGETAAAILKNFAGAEEAFRKARSDAKQLSAKSEWLQFDGAIPSLIPQDQLNSRADVLIQPNVMAVVDNGGQTGLIQLGTLLKIGDVWKLTRLPQPLEGNAIQIAEDTLFMPALTSNDPEQPTVAANTNPKLQKLIDQLQAHDKATPPPTANRNAWSQFNLKRVEILTEIAVLCDDDAEREDWLKQVADSIASGVQTDTFAGGLERLRTLEAEARRKFPKGTLVPYIAYRRMTSENSLEMQKISAEKFGEFQDRWLKKLENFISEHPTAEDTPEATFQLASTLELTGKLKECRTWYKRLSDTNGKHPAVARAQGALRRFESKGEKFTLTGKLMDGKSFSPTDYQGRVVLVIYWANWCKPCVEDLPILRTAYEQYHDQGLEIVGVSVDSSQEEAQAWLSQHKISWPQIFEPGGMEASPAAIHYGVVSTPTMFVVDREGAVAHRGSSAEDLKSILTELFRK